MAHWRAKRGDPIWAEYDDAKDSANAELLWFAIVIYSIVGGLVILAAVLAFTAWRAN